MPYSTPDDLLFGAVPPPQNLDHWIQVADDEIDASIGRIYVTPVAFPVSTEARPAKLLIKKVSSMLATGRAIMAIDAGSEEGNVNQYANYLIKEACRIIEAVSSGDITLDGVQMLSPDDTTSAPKVYNVDTESLVESFYGNFQAPPWPETDRPYWACREGGE